MNSVITQTIIAYIQNSPYGGLTAASGIVVLALLIIFLFEAVVLESASNQRKSELFHSLDVAALPLLFALFVMALVRFAQFMHVI